MRGSEAALLALPRQSAATVGGLEARFAVTHLELARLVESSEGEAKDGQDDLV
jgi:hypothetical protein